MQNKTQNDPDYNFSESIKKENKTMNCKDGFCFIPNLEEKKTISNENLNIFDPIQIDLKINELCFSNSIDHFKTTSKYLVYP